MAGKPQRDVPKASVQICLDPGVLFSVLPLLNTDVIRFSSRSQLIETIIFLSEHMYIKEPNEGFILELIDLRGELHKAVVKSMHSERRRLHVTLDKRAVTFVDMLGKKYSPVFRNRSEVVELLLCNIGRTCNTPEGVRYFSNRLAEVLELHPPKKSW